MAQTGRDIPSRGELRGDRGAGAPNAKPRGRGSRADDPRADAANPGREFGAGGQKDDGPDVTAGAGTGGG